MGTGFEPTWLGLLMIAGAVVLIAAAFGIGLYLFRVRGRPPETPETRGTAAPPPVVEEGELIAGAREPASRPPVR